MAKILLASDFQLGRQFPGLGKSGDLVRKALKDALEKCVSQALESSVDLLGCKRQPLCHESRVAESHRFCLSNRPNAWDEFHLWSCREALTVSMTTPSISICHVENRPDNICVLGSRPRMHDKFCRFKYHRLRCP